jgi:hypothetical protein
MVMKISTTQSATATVDPYQCWGLEDVSWASIRHEAVVNEEELFYLTVNASFMKAAGAELYVRDLLKYFTGDSAIQTWLKQEWQQDELQHAGALKRYIQIAWPEFAWDTVYEYFFSEFAANYRNGDLAPSRSLEMAARCVLETAAAGYYTALRSLCREPLLRLLAWRISVDEMRHYQHFYRYFGKYRRIDNTSRGEVLQAMWRRLKLQNRDDHSIVMKHVYGACHPSEPFDLRKYRNMQKRCRRLLAAHIPRETEAMMLLKPLELGSRAEQVALPMFGMVIQRFVT